MNGDQKWKVLMVHNYYQIPGGEDTVVTNEKRLLEEHGHEVVLYTRHNNELKSMSKLQKLGLPFTTIFNPKTYSEIKKIIKEQGIEIVHVHNTLNLISPAVYYAAVKCKVPVVQTIHNFRFLCPGATFYRDGHICEDCINKGLGCAVKHKCYRASRAQTLICVINTWIHRHTGILRKINYIALTEFNKSKLLQLNCIDPEKVFVRPNFTFTIENAFGNNDKGDFFLYVGRIEEIKGIERLIRVFQKIPQYNLELAGDGPLLEEMIRYTREQGTENIVFLGRIDHDSVMKKMKMARAVIVLSQVYEGFPMTIVEAYSVGTPVIGSNFGNIGNLIEEGKTGFKTSLQEKDIIATIERSTEGDDLTETVYQVFRSKYTAENAYRAVCRIYGEAEGRQ